jgi:hypothetical protein
LRKRPEGPQLVPESFWTRFGADTAIVDTNWDPPRVSTWSDVGVEKRRRQAERVDRKRGCWDQTTIRPVCLWVFHCPGLGGCYEGWWTYLYWRGGDSGKYLDRDEQRIRQLMDLFPMADGTLFGPALTHEQWQIRFAKAFCCRNADGTPRKHAGRIQGKALLWAEFHGGYPYRILGRAYTNNPKTGMMGSTDSADFRR